jgi:hypothetical protein
MRLSLLRVAGTEGEDHNIAVLIAVAVRELVPHS